MRTTILIVLLFAINPIGMTMKPINTENLASITIMADSCVALSEKTKINIYLKNLTNYDYWINSWSLSSVILLDNGGNKVRQIKKIEEIAPDSPQFQLVKKGETISIELKIKFAEFYELAKGQKYKMQNIYENSLKKKMAREKTLIGKIQSKTLEIRLCDK